MDVLSVLLDQSEASNDFVNAVFLSIFFFFISSSFRFSLYANSPLGSASDRNNAAQLSKIMEKSKKVAETFRFFVNTEWTYTTTKLMKMFKALQPEGD
jgi:hypothetical protein